MRAGDEGGVPAGLGVAALPIRLPPTRLEDEAGRTSWEPKTWRGPLTEEGQTMMWMTVMLIRSEVLSLGSRARKPPGIGLRGLHYVLCFAGLPLCGILRLREARGIGIDKCVHNSSGSGAGVRGTPRRSSGNSFRSRPFASVRESASASALSSLGS